MARYSAREPVLTSQEVAVRYGAAHITVRKWAAANGVAFIGEGARKPISGRKMIAKGLKGERNRAGKKAVTGRKNNLTFSLTAAPKRTIVKAGGVMIQFSLA